MCLKIDYSLAHHENSGFACSTRCISNQDTGFLLSMEETLQMLELILKAFILGVVVAIPVGPVSIAAARRAITYGFSPAFFFNLGSLASDGFYILLVYVGLAPLLSESETLRLILWIVGGAWLCWLGWE